MIYIISIQTILLLLGGARLVEYAIEDDGNPWYVFVGVLQVAGAVIGIIVALIQAAAPQ